MMGFIDRDGKIHDDLKMGSKKTIYFHENAWQCPKCGKYNMRCIRYAKNNPRKTKCCRCGYDVFIEIGTKTATREIYYLKKVTELPSKVRLKKIKKRAKIKKHGLTLTRLKRE